MYKILHITPHMGGGVGKVISSVSSVQDGYLSHAIILQEEPENMHFVNIAKESGIAVFICPNSNEFSRLLTEADIVIIHWWHHPKTSRLLYTFPKIPVRLMLWTHISSLTVPALAPEILLECTRVLFTTEGSYDAECFSSIDKEILNQKTGVVLGTGGFDCFSRVERKPHDGFNIGYLGFVDFSKLHPDFISFCKAVNLTEAKFILAGDAPAKDTLEKQAKDKGIANPFIYSGYVTDVSSVLCEFDVFGYPLMPFHTCTTENTILEAMAAEVPPVLINQLVERHIIEDRKTGLLVSSTEEYGNAMRYLYENPSIRMKIGSNARDYVINKYKRENILKAFYQNCEITMREKKRIVEFKKIIGNTPAEWFLSCLGKDKPLFLESYNAGICNQTDEIKKKILCCSPLMKGKSKSSVFHYKNEFADDSILNEWADIIREDQNKDKYF